MLGLFSQHPNNFCLYTHLAGLQNYTIGLYRSQQDTISNGVSQYPKPILSQHPTKTVRSFHQGRVLFVGRTIQMSGARYINDKRV